MRNPMAAAALGIALVVYLYWWCVLISALRHTLRDLREESRR